MTFMRIATVVLIFLMLGSCREPDIATSPPLGPEVPVQKLDDAESEALAGTSVLSILEGQMSYYQENLRVEVGPVQLAAELTTKVKRRTIENNTMTVVYTTQETTYSSGQAQVGPEKETVLEIPLGSQQSDVPVSSMPSGAGVLSQGSLNLKNLNIMADPAHVTIHNLVVEPLTMSAPNAVQARPNCLNIPNCQVTGKKISFDVVKWAADGSYDRAHVEEFLSKDVPYISPTIYFCVSQMAVIQGNQYFVRQCKVLMDFLFKTE